VGGGAVHTYWTYILASRPYGTLYIGVTNSLLDRVEAHRAGSASRFTARYGVSRLVYYEPFADIEAAIQREKTLKHWVRQWKINLIERENPHWLDLYPTLLALPGNRIQYASGEMGPRDKREDDT
jgi:putative endonuclease